MRLLSAATRPSLSSLNCLSSFGAVGGASTRLVGPALAMGWEGAPSSLLTAELVNAWSIGGPTLNSPDLPANLFAVSIVPYLFFLFFLSRPETKTPPLGAFGFQFLLVFVGATIPAGILAKVQYHDILANVDWLHGLAEAFLTLTNLLIVGGFRPHCPPEPPAAPQRPLLHLQDSGATLLALLLCYAVGRASGALAASPFPEPPNALSLPTWAVHVSSLLEWLLAMRFVWQYSAHSNNPRWREMTWAMLPAHFSGACACIFHFFFNSSSLSWLLTLQAGATCLSNTLMARAAYRIFSLEKEREGEGAGAGAEAGAGAGAGAGEQRGESLSLSLSSLSPPSPSTLFFYLNLSLKTLLLAGAVKYGERLLPLPFAPPDLPPQQLAALGLVSLSPLLNGLKYLAREREAEEGGLVKGGI